MEQYKHFKTIDFLNDDSFVAWAKNAPNEEDSYWESVFQRFPEIKAYALEARIFIREIKIKSLPGTDKAFKNEILLKAFASDQDPPMVCIFGRPIISKRYLTGVACAVAFFLLTFLMVYNYQREWSGDTEQNVSANSPVSKVVRNSSKVPLMLSLPDRSIVILSPQASLKYAEDAFEHSRQVEIEGEVLFDVTRNEDIPFVVHTPSIETTVLGTSFSIDAVTEQVVVLRGLVKVDLRSARSQNNPGQGTPVLVHAGEEVKYDEQHVLSASSSDRAIRFNKQVDLAFQFKNTSLADVAERLHAYYGIPIYIETPGLEHRTVTASLGQLSIQECLRLIAKAVEAEYRIESGRVTFALIKQK